jgi:hypothetical protein
MPWPDRIYEGLYRTSANSDQKERIPRFYSTQMQVMINTLNNMPLSENKLSGSPGICVLMSNSIMFQQFPTHVGYEDPQLSNFYGQALPFLKRGVPVRTLHLENVAYPETWKEAKILIMSYSGMKPLSPEGHGHIAAWVKKGGVLVYCGRDRDPFQNVQEWWNTGDNHYQVASDHLFEQLGIHASADQNGEYPVGKGIVYVFRNDPKEFVMEAGNDQEFVQVVKRLYETAANAGKFIEKNSFYLERGVYDLISVLDEGVSAHPYVRKGRLIDLFDPKLPVLHEKTVQPGEQAFLLNLDRTENPGKPQVLAAASRVYEEKTTSNSYSFVAKSPLNTTNVMRVLLPVAPAKCMVSDRQGNELTEAAWEWDGESHTVLLTFENSPEGVTVELSW